MSETVISKRNFFLEIVLTQETYMYVYYIFLFKKLREINQHKLNAHIKY